MPPDDVHVTTVEALVLLGRARPPVTAHHIKQWSKRRRGGAARLVPVGRRGRAALWAWSDLLQLERDTRSRRGGAYRADRDEVPSNRAR
ncbi:hypothetical protein [Candidatus Frankia alpina]|uniref:Uncharacterized protein n=1 Tax=Candidatus Frankia alpina TaxID=2699483 RepID=A0A4S5EUP2_9ACTN|nr:hypothetical protein [Candidatus Frankia alpina]THJ75820.1 hypothetical protein E7Y31_03335 [Candidatus Frankia alpina]